MKSRITFSDAVNGFLMAAEARHLSPNTIHDYLNTFRKFQAFLDDDPPIAGISVREVEAFLASQQVSKKTVLNYHTGLSALWTWAVKEGLAPVHVVSMVERVNPEKRSIRPYSLEDVKAMLAVLGMTRAYTRPGKKETVHSLPNADRNRAIILLLLDTGIRATELCGCACGMKVIAGPMIFFGPCSPKRATTRRGGLSGLGPGLQASKSIPRAGRISGHMRTPYLA